MKKVSSTCHLSRREQVGSPHPQTPGWRAPKSRAPDHSIPSHELPIAPGIASTPRGRFEFRFHASGIHEEQTPPYPRPSHCQRSPTLSSLKPNPPICPAHRQETDIGQVHSNKEEGNCSRTCRQPAGRYIDHRDLAVQRPSHPPKVADHGRPRPICRVDIKRSDRRCGGW